MIKIIKHEISFYDDLKKENSCLTDKLKKWKNKFLKIINFIKNRLLIPKDKRKDDFER